MIAFFAARFFPYLSLEPLDADIRPAPTRRRFKFRITKTNTGEFFILKNAPSPLPDQGLKKY
jgi:hypothetical protein